MTNVILKTVQVFFLSDTRLNGNKYLNRYEENIRDDFIGLNKYETLIYTFIHPQCLNDHLF